MRGTQARIRQDFGSHRFIPACAGNTMRVASAVRAAAVHPRVCGEHQAEHAARRDLPGSSPRVRGTPVTVGSATGQPRFIPACAGNTGGGWHHRPRHAVHPRVCGEHAFTASSGSMADGSSPRVRGTPETAVPRGHPVRFIPACAGNTGPILLWSWPYPVHPRVCGEHGRSASSMAFWAGSSPRVRGTQPGPDHLFLIRRFIPACAGNTRADHPQSGW